MGSAESGAGCATEPKDMFISAEQVTAGCKHTPWPTCKTLISRIVFSRTPQPTEQLSGPLGSQCAADGYDAAIYGEALVTACSRGLYGLEI